MRVVIAGSGKLGSSLAAALSADGDDVAVVDKPMDRRRLGASFDGLALEGHPMDRAVLEKAGIREAELFVAATGSDNLNAAAMLAVAGFYSVPRSIARFMDPEKADFYRSLGMEAVCPTATGLNQVLDFIRRGGFRSLEAPIDTERVCVRPRDAWLGLDPVDLELADGRRLLGLVRGGRLVAGEGQSIRRNDSLVVGMRG